MSNDLLPGVVSATDTGIAKCIRYLRIGSLFMAINVGNGIGCGLNVWSCDSWWYAPASLASIVGAVATAIHMRFLIRHLRVYRTIKQNTLRLIEAEKVIYLTTNPAESAVDQLAASIEELKRI